MSINDIIKDKLNLMYSDSFNLTNIEEKEIDLSLALNEDSASSIIGKVVDDDGKPVEGATVKLFDKNNKPFKHTFTDATGNYSFEDLTAESYFVTAVKTGCRLTVPQSLILQEDEIKSINFILAIDKTISLATIAGIVYDGETDEKLGGAKVSLVDAISLETVATTKVAVDGEFVFYDVPEGNYKLISTKDGYHSSIPVELSANANSILNTIIKLTKDPVKNTGTVSGVVKHNNAVVSGVYVGLYKIEDKDGKRVETLIATTKTNTYGAYMFGDVTTGDYVVKSKQNK